MENLSITALSLLLASLLIVGSKENKPQKIYTLSECPRNWNISCKKHQNVWQLQCFIDENKWNLSLHCIKAGQNNNDQCLKLTVSSKETYEMSNKCTGSSQSNNRDQRSSVKIASSSSPVRIQLCPNCQLKTDDETGTSLMFYSDKQSWIEALNYCLSFHSSLVQITNQTVQDAVINLLKNETGLEEGIWVGLERSIFGTTNIEWMWTSRNRTIHPEWNSRVDPLNNHCGKIVLAGDLHRVKLDDANCHHILPFICQDPV
ncbi:hypothetical protein AMECASPLE_023582 [Ameca splendens]|uniref:C-type lectin domain-containing protein n=1 Tax=Ameca splendens TaxID=208324 RepID=A0ABV0ZR64_9TELE